MEEDAFPVPPGLAARAVGTGPPAGATGGGLTPETAHEPRLGGDCSAGGGCLGGSRDELQVHGSSFGPDRE